MQGLDRQCIAVLEMIAQAGRPTVDQVSPAEARAGYRQTPIVFGGPEEAVARVEDRVIEVGGQEIPLRIYRARGDGEKLPILVFFHGGGWVIGDLETHDKLVRSLTLRAGCVTVAVDYRLAPEHPFPAAIEDSFAALQWVAANRSEIGGDDAPIAIAGDSAGGNIAAVMALLARDAGGPALAMQVLIYPATAATQDSPSHLALPDGPILTKPVIDYFYACYVGGNEAASADHRFAPMLCEDHQGLAPAEIIVAGFDPLRDEGLAYGEKLKAAGNQVNMTNYGGMIHGFIQMPGVIDVGKQAIDHCGAALRRAFGTL